MKVKLFKTIAGALATVGAIASGAASIGCMVIFIDEPEMPASMIE